MATDGMARATAVQMIEDLIAVPEVDKVYLGNVRKVTDFGAFVRIMPGIDGLLHVSEIAWQRVEHPSDMLQEGDELEVKVLEVDERNGKVRRAAACSTSLRAGKAPAVSARTTAVVAGAAGAIDRSGRGATAARMAGTPGDGGEKRTGCCSSLANEATGACVGRSRFAVRRWRLPYWTTQPGAQGSG